MCKDRNALIIFAYTSIRRFHITYTCVRVTTFIPFFFSFFIIYICYDKYEVSTKRQRRKETKCTISHGTVPESVS